MSPEEILEQQLLDDYRRLGWLITEYARTLDRKTKIKRDRLEGAVQVKEAVVSAIRDHIGP